MKRWVLKGMIGIVSAVVINYVAIAYTVSQGWLSKEAPPCIPELAQYMQNDTSAVILQTVVCAAIGFGIAMWSAIKSKRKER